MNDFGITSSHKTKILAYIQTFGANIACLICINKALIKQRPSLF